jgi:hypothetical protein
MKLYQIRKVIDSYNSNLQGLLSAKIDSAVYLTAVVPYLTPELQKTNFSLGWNSIEGSWHIALIAKDPEIMVLETFYNSVSPRAADRHLSDDEYFKLYQTLFLNTSYQFASIKKCLFDSKLVEAVEDFMRSPINPTSLSPRQLRALVRANDPVVLGGHVALSLSILGSSITDLIIEIAEEHQATNLELILAAFYTLESKHNMLLGKDKMSRENIKFMITPLIRDAENPTPAVEISEKGVTEVQQENISSTGTKLLSHQILDDYHSLISLSLHAKKWQSVNGNQASATVVPEAHARAGMNQ